MSTHSMRWTSPTAGTRRSAWRGRRRAPPAAGRPPRSCPAPTRVAVRDVAVEAGIPGLVLGEVRDARRRVDGDGLVQHAAHADDRLGRRPGGVRAHLEHVAVPPPAARGQVDHGFLAAQPRAPGRRAARAVVDRPAERGPRAHPAPAAERQRRRAARRRERLPGRRRRVIARRREDRAREPALVIAHQRDLEILAAAFRRDDAHAVVRVGCRGAVRHHVAGPGIGAVLEAFRQVDQRQAGLEIGHGPQRSVRTRHESRLARTGTGSRTARLERRQHGDERCRPREESAATEMRRHPRILRGDAPFRTYDAKGVRPLSGAVDAAGVAAAAREVDVQVGDVRAGEVALDERLGGGAVHDFRVHHLVRGVVGAHRKRPQRQVRAAARSRSAPPPARGARRSAPKPGTASGCPGG